jgi:hypothetical protein
MVVSLISCDEVAESSSSLGASKNPTSNPVEDQYDSDDDSGELENSNLISLLCHTCQPPSTTLQAV